MNTLAEERMKVIVMRVVKTKKITKVVEEEITVKRICDNCGKELAISHTTGFGNQYNYFRITTHHHDWGNDSIESYESYDACCPKCAVEMAEKYLTNAYPGYNTKTIEIEHIRGLEGGTSRTYKHNIEED